MEGEQLAEYIQFWYETVRELKQKWEFRINFPNNGPATNRLSLGAGGWPGPALRNILVTHRGAATMGRIPWNQWLCSHLQSRGLEVSLWENLETENLMVVFCLSGPRLGPKKAWWGGHSRDPTPQPSLCGGRRGLEFRGYKQGPTLPMDQRKTRTIPQGTFFT